MAEQETTESTPPAAVPLLSAGIPDNLMHKNRLQEYTQRSSIPLPIYQTVNEGFQHAPRFRSTVLVDGATYTSPNTFVHRKAAEQDVARLAMTCIAKKLKDEGCPLIREDTVFSKSILNEFAVKMNFAMPTYMIDQPQGLLPVYVSTLVFNGVSYTGGHGRNKKEAEQLAARAAILSLLGDSESGTVLSEIIKSKFRLFAALHRVKDSVSPRNYVMPLPFHSEGSQNPGNGRGVTHNTGKEIEVAGGSGKVTHNTGKEVEVAGGSGKVNHNTGKEVEVAGESGNILATANLGPSSGDMTNHPVAPQPFHEFRKAKQEPVVEEIAPPIVFVPPISEQPLAVYSGSSKKRNRRNKKKAEKKLRVEPQLEAAVLNLNQAPSCSVAQ